VYTFISSSTLSVKACFFSSKQAFQAKREKNYFFIPDKEEANKRASICKAWVCEKISLSLSLYGKE
jgi:hypothetical protein